MSGCSKEGGTIENWCFKMHKDPACRPRYSPELMPIIEDVPEKSLSSPKGAFVSKSNRIRKPQLTRKGVVIREIQLPFLRLQRNEELAIW